MGLRLAMGAALAVWLAGLETAAAQVRIDVDLRAQRMHVSAGGNANFDWPISSGMSGHETPRGTFAPYAFYKMIYSWKYGNEPMPFTIFFRGNYAIHGSRETDALGHPASHGCVRLAPENAELLYNLAQREGAAIHIDGTPPPAPFPPPPRFANHGGL